MCIYVYYFASVEKKGEKMLSRCSKSWNARIGIKIMQLKKHPYESQNNNEIPIMTPYILHKNISAFCKNIYQPLR